MKRREREPGQNIPAKPITLGAHSAKGWWRPGDPRTIREGTESTMNEILLEEWLRAGSVTNQSEAK